jgi:hypothetical protein
MLGRNGNVAYVRYDSHGRIVPGGPIISAKRPSVGLWQPVSYAIGNSVTSNSLRAFVRLDAYGRVVPSSLLLLAQAPSAADSGTSWLEINATYVPYVPGSTTTTTTTATPISTTTTTTSVPGTTTTTTTAQISTTTTTTLVPSTTTTTTAVPTTTTTTTTPGTTTTTTTTGVLDCTLGAVVNPTFPGGPVGLRIIQSCTGGNPPRLILTDYTGGSGSYTILTIGGAPLLQYPDASYATTPISPNPIVNNYTISKLFTPGWTAGTTFWLVFADFYDHSNQILVTIVIEGCPPPPPSNTVFMKFDIL